MKCREQFIYSYLEYFVSLAARALHATHNLNSKHRCFTPSFMMNAALRCVFCRSTPSTMLSLGRHTTGHDPFKALKRIKPRFLQTKPFAREPNITLSSHEHMKGETSAPGAKLQSQDGMRLSKVISKYTKNLVISRGEAERMIQEGEVTVAGKQITSPHYLLSLQEAMSAIKVNGKLLTIKKESEMVTRARVWVVHKLKGEVVTAMDPHGRPSLLERLRRGGVGRKDQHLHAVGRLDMSTEGLILVTNDSKYKRELELPSNKFHRVYRVRVHGKLLPYKLKAIRNGIKIGDEKYQGMRVQLEDNRRSVSSTNNWLRLTCVEGKNRQIRKVLNNLGLNVTRLIRISFGDYDLNTIPPGLAIEVPVKNLMTVAKQGKLRAKKVNPKKAYQRKNEEDVGTPIKWVKSL